MTLADDDIYRSEFVRGLFDEMSATYGIVNVLSSLGFCVWWRRQCAGAAGIRPGDFVVDFFSGMGELWPDIVRRAGRDARVTAVDFSPAMCARSQKTATRLPEARIAVLEEDVLANSLPAGSADVVVSSFGLKTFTPEQRRALALETARVLRPGGRFAYLEISVPPQRLLRGPFMFYLNRVVPLLGRLLLGNPDNYRMLGVYTTAFGNAEEFAEQCREADLRTVYRRFFFGCATGVVGEKPPAES
jgi:demethylmenaquinone methyltransferase/2-methoxy-6-polyprenyl-1,4-benzoquinol methylase